MILKPQDILFLLKLISIGKDPWIYNSLALHLGMSPSQVHAAAKRSLKAKLAVEQDGNIQPHIANLKKFLLDGLQFVFIPENGELTRGMPTSYAGKPLANEFVRDNDPPPVWPDAEGEVRGVSFSPLYKSAPYAAKKDPELYELLALIDAVRGGRTREREFARKELKTRLDQYESKS